MAGLDPAFLQPGDKTPEFRQIRLAPREGWVAWFLNSVPAVWFEEM